MMLIVSQVFIVKLSHVIIRIMSVWTES